MRPAEEILHEANLVLTSTLDLDSVLSALLDFLAQLVPYDSASILLVDGDRLIHHALRGYERWSDPELVRGHDHAKSNPQLASILSSRTSLLIPDTRERASWEFRPGTDHVLSWMGVPLIASGNVIGLYSLDKAVPGFFTEDHRRLAESLAPQAALAIQNAQSHARERAAREEAERLGAATRALSATLDLPEVFRSILRELRALIPYDSSAVMELHGDRLEIIGGHGFTNPADVLGITFDVTADNPNREVVRTRAPVIVDDAPAHFSVFATGVHAATPVRSWLGVPLLFGDELIGMVTLDKKEAGFFRAEHARLAVSFAAQAAIALVNARLYASAQRELGERSRAEARSRALVEQAPYGIVVLDREERVVLMNAEAERLFGYGRTEILGWPFDLLLAERFRGRRFSETAVSSAGMDISGLRKDATEFDVDVSFGPLETADEPLVMAAVRDVTARKLAEQALRRSEERFEKAFRANPAAMSMSTLAEGRVLDVNERFLAMTGYQRDEVLGRTLEELRFWDSVEEAAAVARALVERHGVPEMAFRFRSKTGEVREAVGSFERIEVPEGPCVLALAEDVTHRRHLEAQLRQAQRMEAVGRLAGGIAHDFNNLLTAILGYSELVLMRTANEPSVSRDVEEIRKAGERAAVLTQQLLAFSRRQLLQPKVLDLGAVVANVKDLLHRVIGEDVELVSVAPEGLGLVKADPAQIEQVLMNLAVNSRDAMPTGGTLTIETANETLAERDASSGIEVRPGPYVVLSVRDTGCGMDAATQSHLFEPFFTTKPKGKGTGLGLSTVYGIVKQSDGYIWADSAPGHGTTFRIYLPRVEDEATPLPASAPRHESPRGTETVLVVEDQEVVRKLVRDVLRSKGYGVLEAGSGADALDLVARHGGPIHLLLTDVVMPGMSGKEVADRVSALRPGIRVLFMSGYADDVVTSHGVMEEGVAFLQKPFTTDDLSRKVRGLLDRPGSGELRFLAVR